MSQQDVLVPDIGSDAADVIEILVKPGDVVTAEQPIVVLESAKASMEVPCPQGGRVSAIAVQLGQSVKQGDVLLQLETEAAQAAPRGRGRGDAGASPTAHREAETAKAHRG